jgi:chorismate dehydratase
MAPVETAEQVAQRVEREQRAANANRESWLERSLAPFRVGSVCYLNAVPLTRGLEEEVRFEVPSELARLLQRDELDAALVSVAEVLLNDRYDILDGVAVASLGEVQSVLLAHTAPIDEVREVYCDPASITSLNLLKALLAERGLHPEFKKLPSYDPPLPPFTLLIGDRALDVFHAPGKHAIWDLGQAWYEITGLPFVYAVWALRRSLPGMDRLRRTLREARQFGLDTLETIIRERTEYDYEFRKDYLGWHIHYHLGDDEKRGLRKFMELMEKHGLGPVYEPRFVV